ncbi:hypothetical protein [Bdellovibrio sp. HCB2-146]|uniref:hypothetical protein n=1 Tax=Bdellovibrio sp. HCB2-146 TaxID=3394362 RepID=UPI0039BD5952
MKALFVLLGLLVSVSASAKEIRLICVTGDAVDMDIVIEQGTDKKETLKVILTGMGEPNPKIYLNSHFVKSSLSEGLKKGTIEAIVSKSDLDQTFGGAYIDAGMMDLAYNKTTKKYDVLFAAEGEVYTGACLIDDRKP